MADQGWTRGDEGSGGDLLSEGYEASREETAALTSEAPARAFADARQRARDVARSPASRALHGVAIIGASALLVFGLAAYATAAVPRFAGSMFLVAVVALLVAALSLLVWILGRLGRLGARVLGMAARSTELTIDQPAARKVPTGPVWAVTVAGRDHVVELHDADSRTGNWVRGGGSPGSVVCDGKLLPLRWQGSYLESSAGFTVGGQPARLICRHSPLDALGHGPSSGWHELLVEGAPVVQTG